MLQLQVECVPTVSDVRCGSLALVPLAQPTGRLIACSIYLPRIPITTFAYRYGSPTDSPSSSSAMHLYGKRFEFVQ
jgi:hypothetical protein